MPAQDDSRAMQPPPPGPCRTSTVTPAPGSPPLLEQKLVPCWFPASSQGLSPAPDPAGTGTCCLYLQVPVPGPLCSIWTETEACQVGQVTLACRPLPRACQRVLAAWSQMRQVVAGQPPTSLTHSIPAVALCMCALSLCPFLHLSWSPGAHCMAVHVRTLRSGQLHTFPPHGWTAI